MNAPGGAVGDLFGAALGDDGPKSEDTLEFKCKTEGDTNMVKLEPEVTVKLEPKVKLEAEDESKMAAQEMVEDGNQARRCLYLTSPSPNLRTLSVCMCCCAQLAMSSSMKLEPETAQEMDVDGNEVRLIPWA